MDDPAFAIDGALPALELDFLDFDRPTGDSQRTSQSMLSMQSRSGSVVSMNPGINISSSSNGGGYQLPGNQFGDSSAQKSFGGRFNNDEDMLVMDDDLFDFDADGNMRDILPGEREARRVERLPRLSSDPAASGRVRQEHDNAHQNVRIMDAEGDMNMDFFNNDYDLPLLPDADPFPVASGRNLLLHDEDHILSDPEHVSSDSAEAKQRKKRTRKVKVMETDQDTQFKNGDLANWQQGYLATMDEAVRIHKSQAIARASKKAAIQYVYGAGLNDVGLGVGSEHIGNPLAMFSGAALLQMVTGISVPSLDGNKRGKKRANLSSGDEQSSPNKRPALDEVARGFEDDNMLQIGDDHEQSMEIGRDAPSALADYPSSAMPWNKSASLLSHQKGQLSRPGSVIGHRLTSASPLMGRGSILPRDLISEQDEMVMYGRSDSLQPADPFGAGVISSSQGAGGAEASQDFELFGAAAGVDTQTAADSQWVRNVLDRESNNFFEYVKNSIDEKFGAAEDEDAEVDELSDDFDLTGAGSRAKSKGKGKVIDEERAVSFEQLFVPKQNSHVVAAQAFYHVLTLATKKKVWVRQDNGVGENEDEPFGNIWVGVF